VTTLTVVPRRLLIAAVQDRQQTITHAEHFLGEAVHVTKKSGGSGEVGPYTVLHPFPGGPPDEQDLGDAAVDLDWLFQITVASGDPEDIPALIDRVDAMFYRWIPTVEGLVCGPCKPPPGFQAGPILVDRDQSPHRFFVPLQYRTTITAT